MISLNIEKTFGFISKEKVSAYEAEEKVTTSWDGYTCLRPSAKSIWLT